jgi:hypothetical protein
MNELIECCICSTAISDWLSSHNAKPFANGRCCQKCNDEFVIPLRLNNAKAPRPEMEAAGRKILAWLEAKNFKLEKPQGSSLHHMRSYVGITPVINGVLDRMQTFVIEHDWFAVIPKETGDYMLPYPICSFEFRISGMRCISIFTHDVHGIENRCNFIGCDGVWVPITTFEIDENDKVTIVYPIREILDRAAVPLCEFIFRQIRAVCIMLEANVATKQTIRASEKLNRQREKRGQIATRDYHVVVLNRKPRVNAVPVELQIHGERNSPRLHFRRGHWRHLINHRTWINWQLVGDPDLGFVDKHYRLS